MLLDRRDAIDALVVGVGVVVSRKQALDLGDAEFLQRLKPQMTIEEKPGSGILFVCHDDGRFDQADRFDRTQHLRIGSALPGAGRQRLQRNDRRNGDRQKIAVEAKMDTAVIPILRFFSHDRLPTHGP